MKKCILISLICASMSVCSYGKTSNEKLWEEIQSHKISETLTVGDKMKSLSTGSTYKLSSVFDDGCSGMKIFIYEDRDSYIEIPVAFDEDGNAYTMYEYHNDEDTSLIHVDKSVINQLEHDFGIFSEEEVRMIFNSYYKGDMSDVVSYNMDMIDNGIYIMNVYTKNGKEYISVPEEMIKIK